jgi:hypothetical protein
MTAARALPCPSCGCSTCCSTCADGGPDQLQVVLSGFTDGSCGTCDSTYNGTFILERYCGSCRAAIGDDESVTVCGWAYTFSSPCTFAGFATFDLLLVSFQDAGGGNTLVQVMIKRSAVINTDCTNYAAWIVTATLPAACRSLEDYEVPNFPTASVLVNGSVCAHDGSSAFITAPFITAL